MAEAMIVIGWFVSPFIKLLTDKLQFYASSQYKWYKGTSAELDRLARSLTEIQSAAGVIERRRIKDPNQITWFNQLKDVIYEAEDVLDDFDYQILEYNEETKVSRFLSSSRKFSKRLIGTDESLKRLKELLKKLDSISSSSQRLMNVIDLDSSRSIHYEDKCSSSSQVTGSLPIEDKVFGREKEHNELVERLIDSSNNYQTKHENVTGVAIVGEGGMGKTALAQLVYNDDRVEKHFELMMWVCVSENFSEIELTREIIQAATGEKHDGIVNFARLQTILRDVVRSKKFLLVLDNVWNDRELNEWENRERWRKVLAPLQYGDLASRILITTRMKLVADMLNARNRLSLKGLADCDQWSLLKKWSLGEEIMDSYPKLQEIGKQIVVKLNGCPLAAKAVGGILGRTRNHREWRDILDRDIYRDINSALVSSYLHLPEHLQHCFAYCSIFPRNWRFDPKKLVKMWISLGLIQARRENGKSMEDLGREYFNQLLARSFFQALKQRNKTYYFMHDLMHDLAQFVSTSECFKLESDKPKPVPPSVRHLSVTSNLLPQLKNLCDLRKLRTLLIIRNRQTSVNKIQEDLLAELKRIRVLDLSGCDVLDLPENVGQMIHLRYLAFPESLKRIPESISKLLQLQTLIVPKKSPIDKLPEGMGKLTNLRHLDIDLKYIATISGIGGLVNLQGSVEFHVKKENGCNLEELKDIKDLHGELSVKNLEIVANKEEASKCELDSKQFLKVLKLEWSSGGRSLQNVTDAEVLEGLKPNANLEELYITRYRGGKSPSWLEVKLLCNLKSLYLTNCRKWETLPPLGQLSFLKILHIKEMCSVKQIGREFYGNLQVGFPNLKDLEIDDVPQLIEWTGEVNEYLFPHLKKLKISNCPELVKIPPFPPTIRKMTIERTGLISYLKLSPFLSSKSNKFVLETSSISILTKRLLHHEQLKSIEFLNIRRCKEPVVINKGFSEQVSPRKLRLCQCEITDEQLNMLLQNLNSLSVLEIVDCPKISTLPLLEDPEHLAKIQELHIQDCQMISSLTTLINFLSLKSLVIERCPKFTAKSLPSDLSKLESLNKMSISYCTEFESLPENRFPCSLELLHLIGCHPNLTKILLEKDSDEYKKIASVHKLVIR